MTCSACAAIVFRYSKRVRTFFLPNMCLRKSRLILEIPPCQTPMCGVAYSCSYVLLSRHTTTTARTSCSPLQAAAENTTSDSTNAWQQVKRRGKKSSRGPSPDSTRRQSEQKGATRIKKSVFYKSGIDVSCPEDTLVDYCLNRQVRVASCGF